MSEPLLQQILNAVTNMQKELSEIREEQRVIREEQRAIREEQRAIREEQQTIWKELQAIRQEQQVIRKEQQTIWKELQAIQQEQQAIRKEQQALKNGQQELYDLMTALLHRQDETDAKLEVLSTDIHHMRGEIAAMKQDIQALTEKVDTHNERLTNLQLDVDFVMHKTTMNERELYKIRSQLL